MLPALLTTLFFSFSAIAGNRLSRILGGIEANFVRIVFATLLLAGYAHTFGDGVSGNALPVFFLSGVIGFGIGDLALYQAFPLLGSRLCMILVHCLAAPIAASLEWVWLGTVLSPFQLLCSLVTLTGVAIALAPGDHLKLTPAELYKGTFFGIIAAFGQGCGAVVSRKAFEIARAAGESPDGLTAAYQRILGGVVIAALSYLLFQLHRSRPPGEARFAQRIRSGWKWLVLNGVLGPALGVGCFQWALSTTPTGIVLPIVALTPLTIIPFSQKFEGEKPGIRSLFGGVLAVLGVVGLRFSLK